MTAFWAELLVVLLFTGAAALIGWLAGDTEGAGFMAACALGVLVLRHFAWMVRLLRWARAPMDAPTPSARGAWAELFNALEQRARRIAKDGILASEELERLRRAAEALPEGVMILDGHRAVEWMNNEAEACLGLRAAVDTGSRITHLLREPQLLAYLDSVPRRVVPFLLRTQRCPGRTLQVQAVPFAAGRTLLMVRDITQLEKLATMRRDFVANVSHELKTPLTVVLGFIETASDALVDGSPEELAQYLHTAAEQARRMQHLVDDLLMLSSLETDAPPTEEVIDMAALLAELQVEAEALSAGRHRITLKIGGPLHLLGSSREVRSALGNLVTNAVRYTPAGGAVVLSWAADATVAKGVPTEREVVPSGQAGARFSVTDTGPGIAAEHLPRLTERFYRVDRGRSRELGGTGLGLAIVKHVLERHQAQLEIDSEVGTGSTFSVVFPGQRLVEDGGSATVA